MHTHACPSNNWKHEDRVWCSPFSTGHDCKLLVPQSRQIIVGRWRKFWLTLVAGWIPTVILFQKFNIVLQFTYVGHSIKCYKRVFNKKLHLGSSASSSAVSFTDNHFSDAANNVSCVCRDVDSNLMKQCNNYSSLDEACTTTLSTLIRFMAYKKLYQLPCDANLMPPPCDTS